MVSFIIRVDLINNPAGELLFQLYPVDGCSGADECSAELLGVAWEPDR